MMSLDFEYYFDNSEYFVCLHLLESVASEAKLLRSRLNAIENMDRTGTINWENKNVELAKIRMGILELYNLKQNDLLILKENCMVIYDDTYKKIIYSSSGERERIRKIIAAEIGEVKIKNTSMFSGDYFKNIEKWLPLLILKWSINNFTDSPFFLVVK